MTNTHFGALIGGLKANRPHPAVPTAGTVDAIRPVYLCTDTGEFCVSDGQDWTVLFSLGIAIPGLASNGLNGATLAGRLTALGGLVTNSDITANRPVNPRQGEVFFDTTLGLPIWYDGAQWVDSTGAPA